MPVLLVERNGVAHLRQVEVVEHDDVGLRGNTFRELRHRLHFHFHLQPRHVPARGLHRPGERARRDDVVLFDEHHVEQPHAKVRCPAAQHGVFLRGAQARQGLARVENRAARSRDRIDIAPRFCSHR